MHLVLIVWLIFSLFLSLMHSLYVKTLTFDDIYIYGYFNKKIAEGAFFDLITELAFNKPLIVSGEFRTYGLSKIFQLLVHLVTGGGAGTYQFIITFMHMLSGILVYRLLSMFHIDCVTNLFICGLYAINPFMYIQTFHHFTYLMLPLYILILYILREVSAVQASLNGTCCEINAKSESAGFILIFLTVFTGEYILSMLAFVLFILIAVSIHLKNRPMAIKYVIHTMFFVFLSVGWYLVWNYMVKSAGGNLEGRFAKHEFNFIAVFDFFSSMHNALKRFLFFDQNWHLYISSLYRWNILLAILIVCMFVLLIVAIFFILKESKNKKAKEPKNKKDKIGFHVLFFTFGFTVASSAIYIALNMFRRFVYFERYFIATLSLTVILACILIKYFLPQKACIFIFSAVFCVFISYQVLWCAYLRPHIYDVDTEIINEIDKAVKDGYTEAIIFTDGTILHTTPFLNMEYREPLSAFSTGWTIRDMLLSYFDSVVMTTKEASMSDNADGSAIISCDQILVNYEMTEEHEFNKNETLFMSGYRDISNLDIIKTVYSTSFDEFTKKNGIACYEDIILENSLILINAGTEIPHKGFAIDAAFNQNAEFNNIRYGYKGDSGSNIYGKGSLSSNRYGTDFSYKFEDIPRNIGSLDLLIVMSEIWESRSGQRVFDIIITTDVGDIVVKDVDPYDIQKDLALAWISPARLKISLPETTSVTVTFKSGGDILKDANRPLSFVNIIGLVKKQ